MATKKAAPKNSKNTPVKPKKAAPKAANISRWFPLILILATFLLYSRSINSQYVQMDDTDLILENEPFISNYHNLGQAFKQSCFEIPAHLTDSRSYYRPLLILSFMVDAHIYGTRSMDEEFQNKDFLMIDEHFYEAARSSVTFHFMNILYHILVILLLYYLLLKLAAPPPLSLVLSLLFAFHPVNVHAIAWVPGRNDPILAVFTLVSFHGLINYYRHGKAKDLILHLVSYTLALFSKESGVILLPLFFLFLWLWEKDFWYYKRKFFIPVIYIVITVCWYIIRRHALNGNEEFGGKNPVFTTLLHNLPYLFLYIGKILLPFNLSVMPGVNTEAIILGIASFIGLGCILYFIKDRQKVIFCVIWYFLFLLPTLIVPELPAYEHRDYLPLIGLILGISQASFFTNFSLKSGTALYAVVVIGVVFIVITSIRIPVFANCFDFWQDATENTSFAPSAYVNIGQLHQEMHDKEMEAYNQGMNTYNQEHNPNILQRANQFKANAAHELELAGEFNKKAIDMDSTTLLGNNNYGAYLYLTGHQDEAVKYFQREIKFNPHSSDPVKNMGIYYKEKGQSAKSVQYWEKLIQMNRYNFDAYNELIGYYRQTGDFQKALAYKQTGDSLYQISKQKYDKLAR